MTVTDRTANHIDLARRRGRWVELQPVDPRCYERLWRLVLSEAFSWPWHGRPVGYQGFLDSLNTDAISQYVVVQRATGEMLGLVRADKPNLYHQHLYVSMFLDPEYQQKGWPMEAMPLFIDYLFTNFHLRKIYGESSEAAQHVGDMGSMAEVEGTLKDHFYVAGRWVDMNILSLTHERWVNEVRPKVAQFLWRTEPIPDAEPGLAPVAVEDVDAAAAIRP